ncbi:ParB N-terminal domain-containing protein [Aerococcaceae bacterium NML190073]|nr:ParB N-terminal domain-containing protein [Aerococcaceae bacterium NML190073]
MREAKEMEIVYLNVDDLIPYEHNPRINDHAVDALAHTISTVGFREPIKVTKDYVIICGHTRYKACRKLGIKKVPCIIEDDLTPEETKLRRISDNSVAELAQWNYELLQQELAGLSFDMEAFGLEMPDDTDLDDLFEEHEEEEKVKQNYLVWHGGKVETTEVDEETLNQLLEEYEDSGSKQSFVLWLTTGRD